MLATILLAAAQAPVAYLVERAARVEQASAYVRPSLGDRTVWGVAFALVLGIGLTTFVRVNRSSAVARRETGRGRWGALKGGLLAIVLLDALLTGFVFWSHTMAR